MKLYRLCILFFLLFFSTACSQKHDYSVFLQKIPRSVLVLPPVNLTADVAASNAFISTVSRPLAEAGYYVYPIAVVDRMMKENGVPTPGDMRTVPLNKLGEVFGTDAVLYITIKDWSTRYLVVKSYTEVQLEYSLVDIQSGQQIWHRAMTVSDDSGGNNNLAGMLASALVHAVSNMSGERERALARRGNYLSFNDKRAGLIKGPRHPKHEDDKTRIAQK